jgi:CHAT domain-containing protein
MRRAESALQAGAALLAERKFLRARHVLLAAVEAGGADAPWAVQELVQTYLRRGDAAKAEPFLRRVLPEGSPLLVHALGYLWRRQGRGGEALAALERAAASRRTPWAPWNELGWMLCAQGDDARGLPMLRAAARHFERTGDAWGHASSLTHQSTLALVRFRLDDALRLAERARELKVACGDRLGLGTCLYNEGVVRMCRGDYGAARDAYLRSLDVQESVGSRDGVAACLNGIGICCIDLGDVEGAEESFRAARTACARGGAALALKLGQAEANLGYVALHRGDVTRALAHLGRSLLHLDGGGLDTRGEIVSSIAELHVRRGRPELALQAIGAARAAGPLNARTGVMLALEEARAHLAAGRADDALAAARAALNAGGSVPGPQRMLFPQLVGARVIAGRALLSLGERRAAVGLLRQAWRHVGELLPELPSSPQRMSLLDGYREAANALVDAEVTGGFDPARAGWAVASDAKALELRRALAHARGHAAARAATDGRLEAIEAEMRLLSAIAAPARRELARLARLRRAHRRALARGHGRARPRHAPLRVPCLTASTAILEYHVGAQATHAFVATSGGIEHLRLHATEARLDRDVTALVATLREASRSPAPTAVLGGLDLQAMIRLAEALVEPVLAILPARTRQIVVVPDGPLHALPFELLPRAIRGGGPAPRVGWLADTHVLAQAPSSRMLRALGRRRGARTAHVVGYSPRPHATVRRSDGDVAVTPLPGALREARAVSALYEGCRPTCGASATAEAVLAAGRGADVLHVAAHAFADMNAPGLSGIVLAPEAKGAARAAFLSAERVAAARVDAELVVLSACESAAGALRRREGVLGLTRAFLEAGATAVLASRWSVDDHVARDLMVRFHRQLRAGAPRADALAVARRDHRRAMARRAPELDHPFYWAAFGLVDLAPG